MERKQLTLVSATSLIIGHGVGSGILAVPYLASLNNLASILIVCCLAYLLNLGLHLMIASISYAHHGAQLVECFKRSLFSSKLFSWLVFILLGFSVMINIAGFLTGAQSVLVTWLALPPILATLAYYFVASSLVFFGLKLVGIAQSYAVAAMIVVLSFLLLMSLQSIQPIQFHTGSFKASLALFSMVSFSLSAVMSVPQVVKGVQNKKDIFLSITLGSAVNFGLIVMITLTTLLGAHQITQRGALVDLAESLGGWVSIIGYVFSLLALSTSFWANALNLQDVIKEQLHTSKLMSWLIASLPCLFLSLAGLASFVGFVRLAGIVQILTGLACVASFHNIRKKGQTLFLDKLGGLPVQLVIVLGSVLASLGALLR